MITRPEHRDEFALRVELSGPAAEQESLANELAAAVRELCRVRVDHVLFVEPGTIAEDARVIVDERTWE
ncbi:MAG: hypothetical protein Q9O62_15545 [Ardenticatenia bacterium]|nr:hypothetical protein [Ardenticatenia bacterium]